MKINKRFLKPVVILLAIIIPSLIINWDKFKKTSHYINVPTDKEILSANDSIKFINDPFCNCIKVVTYINCSRIFRIKEWEQKMKNFPDVPFIFYITTGDKQKIINNLKESDVKYPVFYHPTDDWGGYSLISFVVDSKNEEVDMTNPSMPDFDVLLRKIVRDYDYKNCDKRITNTF